MTASGPNIDIQICGAARIVTGSCYWLQTPNANFLVDCGMYQGTKSVKQLNYDDFPFVAREIDFVLITHAHIDHSGLIPKLYKAGFSGPVYMTEGTRDLLSFMLPDSGYIHEMEVRFINQRYGRRGKKQISPIYTKQEAIDCQDQFRTVAYEKWVEPSTGVRVRYWNAGHILGSASIEIEIARPGDPGKLPVRLIFSGDIGPDNKLFHPDPSAPKSFDYVFCESTYGGINRQDKSPKNRRAVLAEQVNKALKNGGMLLLPAFAVERTQELLADLSLLQQAQKISQIPIFLDSPMAIRATEVFQKHADTLEDMNGSPELLKNPNFHFMRTVDESKSLNKIDSGAIIIAASGMCDAGRIRHHLKARLWDKKTTVMIVGHQEVGSLGHLLVSGKRTVKIQGQIINVSAKIVQLDVYSGHADGAELIDWIVARQPIQQALFLTHGDLSRAQALRDLLPETEDSRIIIPTIDDHFNLSDGAIIDDGAKDPRTPKKKPRLVTETLGTLDWHNDVAQIQIDLRKAFEQSADERSRKKLLRRLQKALEGEKN